MPTKSDKQHRMMEWVAHNPAAAQKTGVPTAVAKEMVRADQSTLRAHIKRHLRSGSRGGR